MLFIEFPFKGIICKDLYIASLDCSAEMMDKKGRLDCAISKKNFTVLFAVTKISCCHNFHCPVSIKCILLR